MELRILVLGLTATLIGWGSIQPACANQREIRFGSVAMDIPAVMHRRLIPLTRYLSHELGRPVSLKLAKDMPGAIKDVAHGTVDLAYLTPVAYLKSHAMGQTRLVAKTITEGKGSFKLMIVVRADSPITSVADLKGKTFAFGDRAALLQRAVVVGAGIKLASLGKYDFLGHYDMQAFSRTPWPINGRIRVSGSCMPPRTCRRTTLPPARMSATRCWPN